MLFKNLSISWLWWSMPTIQATWETKQKDYKFEARLGYIGEINQKLFLE
jgi:hypothetical protein